MENKKWIKWTSFTVSVFIIISFIAQDRFGLAMSQPKCFAKIDGKPVNSQKFFQLLDYQVKMIRERAPQVTPDDFKNARFPEQVLEHYIEKTVKDIELKKQGFVIPEEVLVHQLSHYGQEFVQKFKYLDPLKKKILLEDIRKEMIEHQLILFYNLPVLYQKALYQSLHSKRYFDLITLDYDQIKIEGSPTKEDLDTLVKTHPQEFMEDEKRSFYIIDLNKKDFPISEEDIQHYYEAHKKQFVSPETNQELNFSDAKPEMIELLKHEKLTQFMKELKNKIEEAELTIDDIDGYTPECFKEISANDSNFHYSLNVLNFAFGQDLNILSDIFEDPATGHFYLVQVCDIQPEAQMQGERLKNAAQKIWLQTKKEDIAKQELNNLFQLETKEKEFYDLVKAKNFELQSDLSLDRATPYHEIKDFNPELAHRIFSVGLQQLIYVYTPKGIVVARIKKDVLHNSQDFEESASQDFLRSAFHSAMHLFVTDLLKHHKIEKDVAHLYEECHF